MKSKSKQIFPYLFEGIILSVTTDSFWARLVDLSDTSEPDLEAEFLLEHIVQEDLEKVVEGASFSFLLEQVEKDGQLIGTSRIIFHPVTFWTKEEIEEAKKAGEELFNSIKWEQD